jgi:hypothetical protein
MTYSLGKQGDWGNLLYTLFVASDHLKTFTAYINYIFCIILHSAIRSQLVWERDAAALL